MADFNSDDRDLLEKVKNILYSGGKDAPAQAELQSQNQPDAPSDDSRDTLSTVKDYLSQAGNSGNVPVDPKMFPQTGTDYKSSSNVSPDDALNGVNSSSIPAQKPDDLSDLYGRAPAADAQSAAPAPTKGGMPARPDASGQSTANISDLLSRLTGQQPQAPSGPNPMDELAAAQKQVQMNNLITNLGKAGNTIAGGISRGAYKPDNSVYDDIAKTSGAAPVNNLLQKQAFTGTQTEQALKAMQLADEKEKNDPTKPVSRLAQQVFLSTAKQAGMNVDPAQVANLSAGSIEKSPIWKAAEMAENVKMRQSIAEQNNLTRQSMMGNKQTQQQGKTFGQVSNDLENMRSNPVAGRAAQNLLAADNALSMVNGKDLNKLNDSQIATFLSEAQKIATGGVPTANGMEHLYNPAFEGQFNSLMQRIVNRPVGSNAGELMKPMIAYLGDLKKNSQNVMDDWRTNKLTGHDPSMGGNLTQQQYEGLARKYPGVAQRLNIPMLQNTQQGQSAPQQQAGRSTQASSAGTQKLPENKPPLVQGGHTYIWNAASGQYE